MKSDLKMKKWKKQSKKNEKFYKLKNKILF